jgi:hypothetical protein
VPLQLNLPPVQQTPDWQVPPQGLPQPPQFRVSLDVLTQAPLHLVRLLLQEKSHCPALQMLLPLAGAPVQAWPQVPQLETSFCKFAQLVAPHGSGVAPLQVA